MSLFPISPTNGQTTVVNGITYTYNSAQTAWIRTNSMVIDNLVTLGISVSGSLTSGNLADAVGYKGIPQNARTSQYTLALSDMGFHISITTGGVIIPANSSVAFPIGSTIMLFNNSASTQTISITTDTLRQSGTTNTGTMYLFPHGLATLIKVASTVWVVSGNIDANPPISYLIVAGGGGGGRVGGGGGAGGVKTGSASVLIGSYQVTVGLGGAGATTATRASTGGSSSWRNIIAPGGGGGGSYSNPLSFANNEGGSGGSGGGGQQGESAGFAAGGTGIIGEGNAGGLGYTQQSVYTAGGGGGGGGAVGANATTGGAAGNGGNGVASSISGNSIIYAGGGGGGAHASGITTVATGGTGGGGNGGGATNSYTPVAGLPNFGGGGGGGGYNGSSFINGAAGGSGIVILSYLTGSMTATGGNITPSGLNTIHTFTSTGIFERTS
jgi:hypothetical protein